jgi:hypothetical protein
MQEMKKVTSKEKIAGRILDARERYIPNAKASIESLIHDIGAREPLRVLADYCEEQARGLRCGTETTEASRV